MPELSPAAQAIVQALDDRYELCGPLEDNWHEQCLAAALEALADQVVPEPVPSAQPWNDVMAQRCVIRFELLAIAAELRGKSDA